MPTFKTQNSILPQALTIEQLYLFAYLNRHKHNSRKIVNLFFKIKQNSMSIAQQLQQDTYINAIR